MIVALIASEPVPNSLTITLFGPMHVLVEGQPLPRLRSRKVLWLLALLALRRGRPVEREWLAGTLWPDIDQSLAAANLRVVLSSLRRALGSQGTRVQSPSRHTLSLDLDGAEVDVRVFDAAIIRQDLASLEQATEHYRGPLLEGCSEEWIEQDRTEREQRCLEALQTLADAALAAGNWDAAARHCQRAVALDPWRESPRRGLMRALSGGGDGNAAMEVYQSFARLLRKDDPRAVPDQETMALYTHLRAEVRKRSTAASPAIAQETVPAAMTGNLPHALTDLIGREDEQEEIADLLHRSRLVTLTGPGGIGKTRLAIAVAGAAGREFADGVFLVKLEALTDASQIAPQVAGLFGLHEDAHRTQEESLISHLRTKRVLLVLDNCEHILAAIAEFAGRLLEACAGLRILTTSREALGVTGEEVWSVPPLSSPDLGHLPTVPSALVRVLAGFDSVRLFVERAHGVQKTFALTRDNARAVAHICAHVEGIPLALELAAARVRSLTVHQIEARLDDHLTLLVGGNRAAHSRQQTLRATLDWSYSLLTPSEQSLLTCVSVFVGGWTLEAAQAVCPDGEISSDDVLDVLISLVEKSLVVFEETEEAGRYRLLEMVRQYGAARLTENGRERFFQSRHRDWFLKAAEEANLSHIEAAELHQTLRRLKRDHDNLRAAFVWCEKDTEGAQLGLRLAGALWRYWGEIRQFDEGRAFLHRALSREDAQTATKARGLTVKGVGILANHQGDCVVAREYYEQSLRIFREVGDQTETGYVLDNLNTLAYRMRDQDLMRKYYEEARAHFEQTLAILRKEGDKCRVADELIWLASLASSQGVRTAIPEYFEEAQALFEQSLALCRELGDKMRISLNLYNLGIVAFRQSNCPLSHARFEESLDLSRELGDKMGVVLRLYALGNTCRLGGDLQFGQAYWEESLAIAREIGDKVWIVKNLDHLSSLACDQRDYDTAQALNEERILLCHELGDRAGLAQGLHRIANVKLAQENTENAVRIWGAASALQEQIGVAMPPIDQKKYDQGIEQARAALSVACFAVAWDEGYAMSMERVVEYVLGEASGTRMI